MVRPLRPSQWPFATDEERAEGWREPRFDRRKANSPKDRRAAEGSPTDGSRVRHITEMLLASLAHQHINDRDDRRRFLDAIDNLPDAAS